MGESASSTSWITLRDAVQFALDPKKPGTSNLVQCAVLAAIQDAIIREKIASEPWLASLGQTGVVAMPLDQTRVSAGDLQRWLTSVREFPERLVEHDAYNPNVGSLKLLQSHIDRVQARNEFLEKQAKKSGKHFGKTREKILEAALRLLGETPELYRVKDRRVNASKLAEDISDQRKSLGLDDDEATLGTITKTLRQAFRDPSEAVVDGDDGHKTEIDTP